LVGLALAVCAALARSDSPDTTLWYAPQIASDGRLMEWNEEFKEAEPGHRHISHLFALHPGKQITLRGTPDMAAAARGSSTFGRALAPATRWARTCKHGWRNPR